jgi:serine/threonine protein kinase
MYLNYKCDINYKKLNCSNETILFLRQMFAKDPDSRLSAEKALEHEALLRLEMDEIDSSMNILSTRLKYAPQE